MFVIGTNTITSNDNKYLKQHIYCQKIISTHKQWHNYVITYNYLCHSYHIRVQCQGYRKIIDCYNRREKWTFLLALRTNTNLSIFVLFFCSYLEREKRSVHVSPDSGESCLCFVNFMEFPMYVHLVLKKPSWKQVGFWCKFSQLYSKWLLFTYFMSRLGNQIRTFSFISQSEIELHLFSFLKFYNN